MDECHSNFLFRKLTYDKYLTLEVMLNVEHPEIYNFMFRVNKYTRSFLHNNFITVRNGFINEGLITH